jgi:DNA/RNA-binding domain of Phe-tRNA-synthetase-like protein
VEAAGVSGDPRRGWVADEVADELPGLGLYASTIAATPGRSPSWVRERLRLLSDRYRGSRAVALRREAVPHAYRVFYRHVGMDPDAERTPIEAAVLERLLRGGFRSQNLVDDALTIAVVETGVPVWALDAGTLEGELGIRVAAAHETLGRADGALPLTRGRLVVADGRSPVALLFGEVGRGHAVTGATGTITLFSLQVTGVPQIHVEEALWTVQSILSDE